MTGAIVLGVLALLVAAILALRVGVLVGYDRGAPWARLCIGPARITLWPREPKKKKRPKRAKGKRADRPKESKTQRAAKPRPKLTPALVRAMLGPIRAALGRLRRAVRIDTVALRLIWAEEDPADAAVHYGRLWAALEAALALLRANVTVREDDLALTIDFTRERPELVSLRFGASAALGRLIGIAVLAAVGVLRALLSEKRRTRTAPTAVKKEEDPHGEQASAQ